MQWALLLMSSMCPSEIVLLKKRYIYNIYIGLRKKERREDLVANLETLITQGNDKGTKSCVFFYYIKRIICE